MSKYKSHRCQESLLRHASVRKYTEVDRYEKYKLGKWFMGVAESDAEWGTTYLHILRVPISYCPFCGKELE